MVRLLGALSALLITTTIFWLLVRGIEGLLPIILPVMSSHLFVKLFVVFCLIMAGITMRRSKVTVP